MKKQRIKAFDLIRTLCTITIVLFHYCYNYIELSISGDHIYFARFPNGNWGGMAVAAFFMLSGAVLWYNYKDRFSVGRFYLRRWLSIFPMFYLAWFIAYLDKAKELGGWYWAGPRRLFIWTILGIDGYFLRPGVNMNYYTLGEWFLGAIVMIYAMFPVLRFIFKEHRVVGTIPRHIFSVILTALFLYNSYTDWFEISDGKNMITCLMGFWIGMLIMEYEPALKEKPERVRMRFLAAITVPTMFLMFAPIEGITDIIREVVMSHICGAVWMIVIMEVGDKILDIKPIGIFCKYISKWSFGIFLVHHVLLYAVMENFKDGYVGYAASIGLFFVNMIIICAVGALLTLWGSLFTKCFDRAVGFLKSLVEKKKKLPGN